MKERSNSALWLIWATSSQLCNQLTCNAALQQFNLRVIDPCLERDYNMTTTLTMITTMSLSNTEVHWENNPIQANWPQQTNFRFYNSKAISIWPNYPIILLNELKINCNKNKGNSWGYDNLNETSKGYWPHSNDTRIWIDWLLNLFLNVRFSVSKNVSSTRTLALTDLSLRKSIIMLDIIMSLGKSH